MATRKKAKSRAKPGKTVTRKVTRGPNKGDKVQFKANSASAQLPGKLVPRKVVKDTGKKNTSTVPKKKRKTAKKKSGR